MATIRIDRGFTQKTQHNVLSNVPAHPPAPLPPKRKKPKSGISGLMVALIVLGSLLVTAGVAVVVVVITSSRSESAVPVAPVQEEVAVQATPVPAAVQQSVPVQNPAAAKPPVASIQAKVRMRYSSQGVDFRFDDVPRPMENDAASSARFALIDSEFDRSGGGPVVLNDGRIPTGADQSKNNFCFRKGSQGGRILVDLGRAVSIKEVNSYSWHSGVRAPQVYAVYGADEESKDFVVDPARGVDPATVGWRRLASVDTRTQSGAGAGQYGVSISAENGTLGSYRFLLFLISVAKPDDPLGNTSYSEIDVIDADSKVAYVPAKPEDSAARVFGEREVKPGSPQGLLCEFYDLVTGNVVDDLRRSANYPAKPDWSIQIKRFELPENQGVQYGARVRGYVVPPKSGSYTFVLNVDDGGEFWLSADDSPANLKKLIGLTKCTWRKWNAVVEQQSSPCELIAGKRYYLEAFIKQASGQDYLAVGWFGPVSEQVTIIDAAYLQPWKDEPSR